MPVLLLAVAALLAAAGAARAQDTPASGDLAPGLRWAQVFMDRMVRVAVPAAPAHAASGDAAHAAPGDAAHAAPGNAERAGYGFIVGEQMLRVQGRAQPFAALLIATADNLVRGATAAAPPVVTFYGDLSRSLPASVLATHLAPEQGNLAVLLVLRPPNARIRPIPAIDTAALLPGIFAWQIGRPDQWLPAETPGRFAAPDKGWLTFDGLDGEAGALGAAVLTDRGLAGMVAGAAPDGRTRVLSVERMRAALRGWRLDWTIADPGAVPLAGPAAAAASALPAAPPGGGDRRGLSVLP
ncbi:MAG: hypothetical protein KGQ40_13615, partial [Rhodospirillales bacterium]|nr:hypothetical protein [Rhodospirillales bacterium]